MVKDSNDSLLELYSIRVAELFRYIRNERLSFWLVCTYLFFEYVRPQSIYPQLNFIPWGMIILVGCIASVLVFDRPRYSNGTTLNSWFKAYLMIVLLSCLVSYDRESSFKFLDLFLSWTIIYFVIVYVVDDERRFFVFLLSFLVYSFKLSQHGAIVFAKRGFSFTAWGVSGPPGWFENSGELGIQMAIFAPLSFFFVIALRKYLSPLKFWIAMTAPVTAVLTAVATSSRGALIGVVCAFFWAAIGRRYFFRIIVAALLLGAIVYQLVPEESKARFSGAGSDHTSLHRVERWQHGWDAMLNNPLLGVGYFAWDKYYNDHYIPKYDGPTLVHNIFVQCGTELGFLGLFVFLGMIFTCFKMGRQTRQIADDIGNTFISNISRGFDAALIGYIASASFVTVQYYPYFWIHCAFVASLYSIARRKTKVNE